MSRVSWTAEEIEQYLKDEAARPRAYLELPLPEYQNYEEPPKEEERGVLIIPMC